MDFARRVLEALDRRITVLIIPQAAMKPWRWQFTAGFLVFCLAVWTGLTVWAGFIASRHVDYWITKADNKVMVAKLTHIAHTMERAQDALDMAKATDNQLRVLLSLSRRQDIVETETAVGGPTAADWRNLRAMLSGSASSVSLPEWHRQIAAIREESAKRLASFQEIAWYIGNQRSLYHATPNMWPTEGSITSLYGYRMSPMRREGGEDGEFHSGIDIANASDTLVYATADGTARHAGWSSGYGRMILIDHGYGISTLYGHTSKALVKPGDRVRRGQVIAYMGTTGRSTGAHLHYEVWRHGKPVNPMSFLKVRNARDLALAQAVSTAGR